MKITKITKLLWAIIPGGRHLLAVCASVFFTTSVNRQGCRKNVSKKNQKNKKSSGFRRSIWPFIRSIKVRHYPKLVRTRTTITKITKDLWAIILEFSAGSNQPPRCIDVRAAKVNVVTKLYCMFLPLEYMEKLNFGLYNLLWTSYWPIFLQAI